MANYSYCLTLFALATRWPRRQDAQRAFGVHLQQTAEKVETARAAERKGVSKEERGSDTKPEGPRADSPVAELFSGRGNGATVPEPLALEELGPKIA